MGGDLILMFNTCRNRDIQQGNKWQASNLEKSLSIFLSLDTFFFAKWLVSWSVSKPTQAKRTGWTSTVPSRRCWTDVLGKLMERNRSLYMRDSINCVDGRASTVLCTLGLFPSPSSHPFTFLCTGGCTTDFPIPLKDGMYFLACVWSATGVFPVLLWFSGPCRPVGCGP